MKGLVTNDSINYLKQHWQSGLMESFSFEPRPLVIVFGSWARFVTLIVFFSMQPRCMDSTFDGISISRVGWRGNNSCSVNACQGTWVCQDWQGSVHTVVTHNNRYFISILTRPPTTFGRLVTYSYLNSTVHVMIVTELFVIHFQVPRRGFRQYFLDRRAVRQYRVLYCNYRPFTVRSITSQNPWLGYKRLLLRLPHTSRFFVAELQIFVGVKSGWNLSGHISLPHTSRFFVATNRV